MNEIDNIKKRYEKRDILKTVGIQKELVDLFNFMILNFNHKETGKYLDNRM